MKVLVIDDSIVFRTAIKTALLDSGEVREVDVAANGKIAIDKVKQKTFDAITLDLEMPVMDGLETIKAIREFNKDIPIIFFSAQNMNAAKKAIMALEVGANDFVKKIVGSSDIQENLKMIQTELVPRFKALINKKQIPTHQLPSEVRSNQNLVSGFKPNLICIGSSTGGPDTLKTIFSGVKKLNVPVLIVQHMPPIFTTQLASNLSNHTEMEVVEAKTGEILEKGKVYIAPGDFHMKLVKAENNQYRLYTDQTDKVCFVRPAVDVLLKSVAQNFNGKVASFILTGMGNDGAEGCRAIKEKNGAVIIQDEASSIVWGMPKAVYDISAYDAIVTPDEIISIINRMGTL